MTTQLGSRNVNIHPVRWMRMMERCQRKPGCENLADRDGWEDTESGRREERKSHRHVGGGGVGEWLSLMCHSGRMGDPFDSVTVDKEIITTRVALDAQHRRMLASMLKSCLA